MVYACNCNGIGPQDFKDAVEKHLPDLHAMAGAGAPLIDAVGSVFRCARDAAAEFPSSAPCATCFNAVANFIKQQVPDYQGHTLPPRSYNADCPRRRQAAQKQNICTTCG